MSSSAKPPPLLDVSRSQQTFESAATLESRDDLTSDTDDGGGDDDGDVDRFFDDVVGGRPPAASPSIPRHPGRPPLAGRPPTPSRRPRPGVCALLVPRLKNSFAAQLITPTNHNRGRVAQVQTHKN